MNNSKLQILGAARRIAAAFTMIACCLGTLAFAGAADQDNFANSNSNSNRELLMSFNETLDSNTTLDGSITLTGAFSERGTRHEDFMVTGQSHDGSQVYLSGTSVITTASGTIRTSFRGTIHFDNATFNDTLLAYVEGIESVTGGTGVYAGATGLGTFEATLDYATGGVLGTFHAIVRNRH